MDGNRSIEVSFDVHKMIESNRHSFSDTPDDVLRRLLKIEPAQPAESGESSSSEPDATDLVTQGVHIRAGTQARMKHKGEYQYGEVRGGKIWVNGEGYRSFSPAAIAITGTSVNGWKYWEVKLPGADDWVLVDALRRR